MRGHDTSALYRKDLLERIRALETEIAAIRRRMAALEAQTRAHEAHIAVLLRGIVEVDETYVGVNAKRNHGRGATNKTVVVGAIQHDGNIRTEIIKSPGKNVVHDFIQTHTHPKTKEILPDD